MDYTNGKIYKLVNDIDEKSYVGSTCSTLPKRKGYHKALSKRKPDRKIYKHLNAIGWDNVMIILIELYPCNNRQELIKRERYWYDKIKSELNNNVPGRTVKDWTIENKEKLNQYGKKYRDNHKQQTKERSRRCYIKNKDKINKYQKEYGLSEKRKNY